MYKLHTACRACGYGKPAIPDINPKPVQRLVPVFDLGLQPLANDFCKAGEESAGYAPLKVLFCPKCSLAQLSATVNPSVLYRHYSYVTSPSAMMRNHFECLIKDIASETSGKSVLEIGSNDGKLLAMMKERGYSVWGIDPAENLGDIARCNGIQTTTGLFNEDTARMIPESDIVIARHVFCHVDDWHGFVRSLESVSRPDTLVCIEVPYVGDMLKNLEFDTIYHEHLSYLSIRSMQALLHDKAFHIHRIIRYPIHGGALLLMLRHNDWPNLPHSSILDFKEDITEKDWREFADATARLRDDLTRTVSRAVESGSRVAGLGASAKSTVWINACRFTRKEISFITDNTLQKQNCFSPCSDIPIVDEGGILRELPNFVVMFAWNYRDEILEKFSRARSNGVKFIVPVPAVTVV